MATYGDVDDVKVALARLLRGPALVATLTEIIALKGDGIWPVLPVTVYEEERLQPTEFPQAEIIAYRTVFDGEHVKQAEHTISVRWTVAGYDESTVVKQVERLVRATTDLLWNETLDTRVQTGPIRVIEEDYSPLGATQRYPFVKSGLTLLSVATWRN